MHSQPVRVPTLLPLSSPPTTHAPCTYQQAIRDVRQAYIRPTPSMDRACARHEDVSIATPLDNNYVRNPAPKTAPLYTPARPYTLPCIANASQQSLLQRSVTGHTRPMSETVFRQLLDHEEATTTNATKTTNSTKCDKSD